jgi:heat shock protein HslJ
MRLSRTILAALAVTALVVVSAGCSARTGEGPGTPDGPPDAADTLEGSSWTLVEAAFESPDLAGLGITAAFEDGQLGGHGGVNSYGASYVAEDDGALELGDVVSTLMASTDEDINAAESAYFAALAEVASYRLEDGRLTLFDADGAELLVFEASE